MPSLYNLKEVVVFLSEAEHEVLVCEEVSRKKCAEIVGLFRGDSVVVDVCTAVLDVSFYFRLRLEEF